MGIIFYACCAIIRAIALITGFTYEEVNTILFIITEPTIILITGLVILFRHLNWATVLLNLIYIFIYIKIETFYAAYSLHDACVQAYSDLRFLGDITGIGYIGINLFLFIILFLGLLMFNIIAFFWPKRKKQRN